MKNTAKEGKEAGMRIPRVKKGQTLDWRSAAFAET